MSGRLSGRVAVVTGAGRGLGRAHALFLAAEGAQVVVNDLGTELDGTGSSTGPAHEIVEEIRQAGGMAVASTHDCANWQDAESLVRLAVESFGDMHVLVNNAGILRDRALVNMSEDEWDSVIRVNLKGHAATSRHALAYWRKRKQAGEDVKASIIHTSSIAAYLGNFGQANYSAAKLGLVALSRVVEIEGGKYGVRSNSISPSGRTRLTGGEVPSPGQFDPRDPANVSPLVAWLAAADCPANGQYFQVFGSRLMILALPQIVHDLKSTLGRWTLEELDAELPHRFVKYPSVDEFLENLRSNQ